MTADTDIKHSYTDDHMGQLIADVINNSDHITANTTLQQTSSPDITTMSNTLYQRTTQHALSSTYDMTTDHNSMGYTEGDTRGYL